MYLVYCILSACIYGVYLVYDVQLVANGTRMELSYDDYIVGALLIYVDVIRIFLQILKVIILLFKTKSKKYKPQ